MAILVSCECGGEFLTSDENAGRPARCGHCLGWITVPALGEEPGARESDPPPFGTLLSLRGVASLVLGLLSLALMILTGLPAVALGVAGLLDIRRSRGHLRGSSLAVAGVGLGLVGCTVVPAFWVVVGTGYVTEMVHRHRCQQNLRQVYQAILSYHTEYRHFPMAAIVNRENRPLLSWRVAILPSLGAEGEALYKEFRLDQAWDSPHNRTLLSRMPEAYRCPGLSTSPPGMTAFQLIVGPGTVFNGRRPGKFDDFSKKKATALVVVEGDDPVPWTAPGGIPFGDDVPYGMRGSHHAGWFHALLANGRVDSIEAEPLDPTPGSAALAPAPIGGN